MSPPWFRWPAAARRLACFTIPPAREDVPIVLRLPRAQRGSLDAVRAHPDRTGAPSPSAS